VGEVNTKLYIREIPCMYPSHKANCVGLIDKSLSSFNGARSFFLSDEDFVGSVNSGW